MDTKQLTREFFARPAEVVARDLLGCTFVGRECSAVIVETEAYHECEPASHSHRGRTERSAPMFGPAGTTYVYFTYGMHWCCNVVTGGEGEGAAVLLRAAAPLDGLELMTERRIAARPIGAARPAMVDLCSGPAKLATALGIESHDNGRSLLDPGEPPHLVRDVEALDRLSLAEASVLVGRRIGISAATELPWRFGLASTWLSRPFPVR